MKEQPITRGEAARRLFSGEWDHLTTEEIRRQFPLIETVQPEPIDIEKMQEFMNAITAFVEDECQLCGRERGLHILWMFCPGASFTPKR
jgi:hypothetical protein